MFSHKPMAVAVLLSAATFSNPGFAQGRHGPGPGWMFLGPPPDLAALDTDGDGNVSQDEMKAARAAEFKTIDADGDGYLTLAELEAWTNRKSADQFKSLDTDSNGSVSVDEFVNGKAGRAATMAKNLFRLADVDGDGALSADEFTTMASKVGKPEIYFAALDSDGDDKLSEAEYLAPPPHNHKPRKLHKEGDQQP